MDDGLIQPVKWTEDSIVAYIEAKSNFKPKEVVELLEGIAVCIKDGSNPSYFSQVIDKILGNTMVARNENEEEEWQSRYEGYND